MLRLPIFMQKVFGVTEIPDELLADALARVKTRCAAVDLAMYKRRPAQARLEIEAIEAIVGTFRDHFPDANVQVREHWPHVNISLKGNRATVEIILGQDYDQGDGIEPFDIAVQYGKPRVDISERIRTLLARAPRRDAPQPEMVLTVKAPPPAAPKQASKARSILDKR